MTQSFFCPVCVTNWSPHHTFDGACCECSTGTRRVNAAASPDADARHKAALRKRIDRERSAHKHAQFDAFYAERERAREVAAREVAAILRALEGDDEPEQHGEAAA